MQIRLAIVPIVFFVAANLAGQSPRCSDLNRNGEPTPRSVNNSLFVFDCPPPGFTRVRIFGQDGKFVKFIDVQSGVVRGNEPSFYPEERFAAGAGSTGCAEGEATRDGPGGTCVGRFGFACATGQTIDVEIDMPDDATVRFVRRLPIARTRPKRKKPVHCTQQSLEALYTGGSIDGVVDGESIDVAVQLPKINPFTHTLDTRALRRGKDDHPAVDRIRNANRTSGHGGGISENEATLIASKVTFRRRKQS